MDGIDKSILIGQNLTHPNGLAIDYSGVPRLYWIDTSNMNIESCNLDGKDRKVGNFMFFLNPDISSFKNNVDPDQMASEKPSDQDPECFPFG